METEHAESLAKWLSLFTIELRKKDGSKYPPATIHLILCGLQRIMRRNNSHPFDIFDKKDVRFRRFHGTMETTYQNLHKEGVGVEIRHASIISEEEEAILWERQILGCHSPKALVRAVFFLNGKIFCLRGGKEHMELKLSQFQRENNHWKYTEYGSKNFRGGLADLRHENKVVRQFACPTAGDHCKYSQRAVDLMLVIRILFHQPFTVLLFLLFNLQIVVHLYCLQVSHSVAVQ